MASLPPSDKNLKSRTLTWVSVISKHFIAYCDTFKTMDYNLVRGDERAFQKLEKLQYGLLISNVIMLIVALANFSVCIWIRSN